MAKKKPATTEFDLPVRSFPNQRAFGAWLARQHATSGVWLKFAKAASGITSIKYSEAIEEALCWGWIDGIVKRLDEHWYVQRFTPRRRLSVWSKINRGKAERLIASGRMQPPGLAEIERAKQDGRWDGAYDSPSRASVPDDLAAALAGNKTAAAFFATLSKQNRYAILFRVQTSRTPATRAKRVAEFVRMLARREKIYP